MVPISGMVTWKSLEELEEEGLELLIGAVDLVDEQDRGLAVGGLEGLEQRPPQQERGREDVVGPSGIEPALRLEQPDLQHLTRVVPLVDRGADVEALVALQADEPRAEGVREHLGQLGLADARLTLEEDRPTQLEGQEDGRDERPVRHVVTLGERALQPLDALTIRHWRRIYPARAGCSGSAGRRCPGPRLA